MTGDEKPVLVLFPKNASGEEILDIMRKMKAEAKKKRLKLKPPTGIDEWKVRRTG